MKCLLLAAALSAGLAAAAPRLVELPGKSPIVTIRIVFTTGAASDPSGKPGLASLTGRMLGDEGTKDLTYSRLMEALYPMASDIGVYSDKEMTVFTGETHLDNLQHFYALMRDVILHPGWREDDFTRVRDDAISSLRISLRGNNDEELGKEELYSLIYAGGPYGHEDLGAVSSLSKLTLADLQSFYRQHYTQANLIVGIAGGYPASFPAQIRRDFSALPEGSPDRVPLPDPAPVPHSRVTLIAKETNAVAWSCGYPIPVRRGDPDFPALLVASSWLGQHREASGRLFTRLRDLRGLNYGDYSYIEYFPQGMFRMEPEPNLARRQQIFQIWIRPVEPPNAVFALRAAIYELNRLIEGGIPPDGFERTRGYLSRFVNVLTKSKQAELGYAIDSLWYGIPNYNQYIRGALAKMTAEDVNRAVRKYLRADRLQIVGVAKDTAKLRADLTSGSPSTVEYNSPKPADVTAEDKIIGAWPLGLRPEDVTIVPVDEVFEK